MVSIFWTVTELKLIKNVKSTFLHSFNYTINKYLKWLGISLIWLHAVCHLYFKVKEGMVDGTLYIHFSLSIYLLSILIVFFLYFKVNEGRNTNTIQVYLCSPLFNTTSFLTFMKSSLSKQSDEVPYRWTGNMLSLAMLSVLISLPSGLKGIN